MKVQFLLVGCLFLGGCFDDSSDIQAFMQQVQQSTVPKVEPLKPVKAFEHIPYLHTDLRSPFVLLPPQQGEVVAESRAGCLQPDMMSDKHGLELMALDTLKMRGTLGSGQKLWALLQDQEQKLHRVTVNDKLGLFHGRIIRVLPDRIDITELIPDGSGCFIPRDTSLQLESQQEADQKIGGGA